MVSAPCRSWSFVGCCFTSPVVRQRLVTRWSKAVQVFFDSFPCSTLHKNLHAPVFFLPHPPASSSNNSPHYFRYVAGCSKQKCQAAATHLAGTCLIHLTKPVNATYIDLYDIIICLIKEAAYHELPIDQTCPATSILPKMRLGQCKQQGPGPAHSQILVRLTPGWCQSELISAVDCVHSASPPQVKFSFPRCAQVFEYEARQSCSLAQVALQAAPLWNIWPHLGLQGPLQQHHASPQ